MLGARKQTRLETRELAEKELRSTGAFRAHHQTCTVGRQREGDGKTVHLKAKVARGLALHLQRQPGDGRPGRRGHARPPELDTQSRARHEKKRRARNDRPHPPRPSNRARVPFGVLLLQLEPRVADVLEPVVRVLGQTSLQQLADADRHAIGERAPVGLPVEDRDQRVARRLAAEGRAARTGFRRGSSRTPRCRCAGPRPDHGPARGSCRPVSRGWRLPASRRCQAASAHPSPAFRAPSRGRSPAASPGRREAP